MSHEYIIKLYKNKNMIFNSTLKRLELTNLNEYFEMILDDRLNGNHVEVLSSIKALSNKQKLAFHYFLTDKESDTALTLRNVLIETVLNPEGTNTVIKRSKI